MARIRSVKPDLRTSLTAIEWPREVRYFWVLLWGYLDDHGYGQDEPRIIKADCLPMDDDLTADDIDKWLELIAESGALCRFARDGRRYLHAPKWSDHQRPQHPALPKYPVCPWSHEPGMSCSRRSHETLEGNTLLAAQPASGMSHESLTPEGEQEQESRGTGAVERWGRNPTIKGNALLDYYRRIVNPRPPRAVEQKVGEKIEDLLAEAIPSEDIQAGLRKLRDNPRFGPGMLPNLVHEARQYEAHPELARLTDARQRAEATGTTRAKQALEAGRRLSERKRQE